MRITIERQNRHRLNKKLLSRTPNMGVILPKLFLFYNWNNILIKGQGFAVLCALDSQYIWYLKFGIDQALNNSKHRAMKFKVRQSIFYYPQLELSLLLLYYVCDSRAVIFDVCVSQLLRNVLSGFVFTRNLGSSTELFQYYHIFYSSCSASTLLLVEDKKKQESNKKCISGN